MASENFIRRWDYLAGRSNMSRSDVLLAAFDILERLIELDEQGKEFAVVDKIKQ